MNKENTKQNIILADGLKSTREHLFKLLNNENATVFLASTIEEIISKRSIINKIDYILVDITMIDENMPLFESLIGSQICQHFFILAKEELLNSTEALQIKNKFNLPLLNKFSPPFSLMETIFKDQYYYAFDIDSYLKDTMVDADLFVKIGADKFVKIFSKGQELTIKDINKFKNKGVLSFYIEQKEKEAINKKLEYTQNALDELKDESGAIQREAAINYVIESMGQIVQDQEALRTSAKQLNGLIDDIQKNPHGLDVIGKLLKGENYHFLHSTALACLLTMMSHNSEWSSVSVQEKLRFASLFHDISLGEDSKLEISWFKSGSEEKIKTMRKVDTFKQHPQKSAQTFVSLLPQVQDVEKIILEHHEKPDGSGFPRGISQAHINNLSTMFIVAENFISLVFDTEIDPTIKRMALKVLERKYSEGNFKKSFEALKKTVGA